MIVLGAASCLSFGDLSGGDTDAGADDASSDDAQTNDAASIADGANVDGGFDASEYDAGPCGSGTEPAVRVGSGPSSFCIDQTEVTVLQYRHFLSALDAGLTTITQPPECSWNTNVLAGVGRTDLFAPIYGVDWCDAYAYCAYAGQRLCGKIGGGALPISALGDPSSSQWLQACSLAPDGGLQQYPYGNTASATACNGAERDAGKVVNVATLPECDGGAPGIFDMSGNVDEWIDSCASATGSTDCCLSVGGGYHDTETSCGIGDTFGGDCPGRTRADAHTDLGFRCCSD